MPKFAQFVCCTLPTCGCYLSPPPQVEVSNAMLQNIWIRLACSWRRKLLICILCTVGILIFPFLFSSSPKAFSSLPHKPTRVHLEPTSALSRSLVSILGTTGHGTELKPSDPILKSKLQSLQALLTTIKSVLPPEFLPGYASPCWYANYTTTKEVLIRDRKWNGTVSKSWTFTKGNGQLYCLPSFYLMGYAKCGTTTVCDLLSKHSLIGINQQWWKRRIDFDNIQTIVPVFIHYMNKFAGMRREIERNPKNSLVGDCAVSTAFQLPFTMNLSTTFPDANPYIMHSLLPQAKFIAAVRNPIYRIRSEYYFFLRTHCKDRTKEVARLSDAANFHRTVANHLKAYEKCMELKADIVYCMYSYRNWIQPESACIQVRLEATMYYYSLSQWLQYFPREQFLIIRTEDLQDSEATVAAEMYNFIGAAFSSNDEVEKEEQSIRAEKVQTFLHSNFTEEDFMHPETRKLLLA